MDDLKFPNGVLSFAETLYQISYIIGAEMESETDGAKLSKLWEVEESNGRMNLAIELAQKFEQQHAGHDWAESELTFYEAIDDFIDKNLRDEEKEVLLVYYENSTCSQPAAMFNDENIYGKAYDTLLDRCKELGYSRLTESWVTISKAIELIKQEQR